MKFIDTHCHVIPHFDDGSQSWDESLDMLKMAQDDGIVELTCTSHILSEMDFDREQELVELYDELVEKAKLAGIDIKIHLGGELYFQADFPFDQRISTYANNGQYFLVEFPMSMIPDFAANKFFDFLMDGKTPVIAHPERNGGFLNHPEQAYEFVERGALLQVTANSITGRFGSTVQALAHNLIEANLAHTVATDAHNLDGRPLKLKDAYLFVKDRWGQDRADLLFYENPRKIIYGEKIKTGPVKTVDFDNKKSFSERFKNFLMKK